MLHLGTFFDSFSKIIIAVPILKNVLKMPGELVYKQIIVSTGFTVFLFSLFNTFLAKSLGKETKNKDITALFGGIFRYDRICLVECSYAANLLS